MTEEEVEVTAPVIRTERSGSLTQPGRMTIVRHVGYGDLDLTTREGAGELRERVRATASGICEDLSLADPADSADFAPCYRQALLRAMPRANAAIRDARNGY
jgi:UrcA family protein